MADLTTEEMNQILVDQLVGREPRIWGSEADALRKSLTKDIADAKVSGYQIEIPGEFEVAGPNDVLQRDGFDELRAKNVQY